MTDLCRNGHPNPAGTRFCTECGQELGSSPSDGTSRPRWRAAILATLLASLVGVSAAMLVGSPLEGDDSARQATDVDTQPSPAPDPSPEPDGQHRGEPASEPAGEIPRFVDGVEPDTASADELFEFVSSHVGALVYLDVAVPDDDVSVHEDQEPAQLTIASASDQMAGAEYLLADLGSATDSFLGWHRGSWELTGHFAVRTVQGPHQGYLSVSLRAVPITAASDGLDGEARDDPDTQRSPTAGRADGFVLPSGNIYCLARDQAIECEIGSGLNPPPDQQCELDWTGVHLDRRGAASPICAGDTIHPLAAGQPVLEYGSTWQKDGIRCSSRRSGLTCQNEHGGQFFLSRSDWHAR